MPTRAALLAAVLFAGCSFYLEPVGAVCDLEVDAEAVQAPLQLEVTVHVHENVRSTDHTVCSGWSFPETRTLELEAAHYHSADWRTVFNGTIVPSDATEGATWTGLVSVPTCGKWVVRGTINLTEQEGGISRVDQSFPVNLPC